jgi:Mg2+-importing ATPase
MVQRRQRWEIGFIRRFMAVFGLLNPVFDYLTLGILYWLLHAGPGVFHTG